MGFPDEQDDGDREAAAPPSTEPASAKPNRKRTPSVEVGEALRAAYRRTMDEEIPPEMLDLLGRLG